MGLKRRLWNDKEDKLLKFLVNEIGTKKWKKVSEALFERGGYERSLKQCRDRWINQLDPKIKKSDWTEEEEQRLFEARRKHGNSWVSIAAELPGRTENAIKNHFHSMIRRNIRQYNKNKPKKLKIKESTGSFLSSVGAQEMLLDLATEKAWKRKNKQSTPVVTKPQIIEPPHWNPTEINTQNPFFDNMCKIGLPTPTFPSSEPLKYDVSELANSVNRFGSNSWGRGESLRGFNLVEVKDNILNSTFAHGFPDFLPKNH